MSNLRVFATITEVHSPISKRVMNMVLVFQENQTCRKLWNPGSDGTDEQTPIDDFAAPSSARKKTRTFEVQVMFFQIRTRLSGGCLELFEMTQFKKKYCYLNLLIKLWMLPSDGIDC